MILTPALLLRQRAQVVRVELFRRYREVGEDAVAAVLEVARRHDVPGQDGAALTAQRVLDAIPVQADGE